MSLDCQWFMRFIPNFTPKNVKLGVFFLLSQKTAYFIFLISPTMAIWDYFGNIKPTDLWQICLKVNGIIWFVVNLEKMNYYNSKTLYALLRFYKYLTVSSFFALFPRHILIHALFNKSHHRWCCCINDNLFTEQQVQKFPIFAKQWDSKTFYWIEIICWFTK